MNPVIMGMMLVLDQMSKLAPLAKASEETLANLKATKAAGELSPADENLIRILEVVRDFTAAAKVGDDKMREIDEELRNQMPDNVIGSPDRFKPRPPCICGMCDD